MNAVKYLFGNQFGTDEEQEEEAVRKDHAFAKEYLAIIKQMIKLYRY